MRYLIPALLSSILLALPACRTADNRSDSDLASESATVWYNIDGQSGDCAPVPSSCPAMPDSKEFVDACVAAGNQAKTCGCEIRCSAKMDVPHTSSGSGTAPDKSLDVCSDSDIASIDQAAEQARENVVFEKCLTGHVCNGNTVNCASAAKQTSSKIRSLAAANCRDQMLERICPSHFVESLGCSEDSIDRLSRGWTAAFQGDNADVKRCYQTFICNGVAKTCDAQNLSEAKALKLALDKPGCGYWLRFYCSLGNHSL